MDRRTKMLNEKDSDNLRSQLSWNAGRQHSEELNLIVQKQEYALISSLGLKPFKDGNQWCFLWGDNIQDGVSGFGDTPYEAMIDFDKNFHREKITI
jgi:hypothetical protein